MIRYYSQMSGCESNHHHHHLFFIVACIRLKVLLVLCTNSLHVHVLSVQMESFHRDNQKIYLQLKLKSKKEIKKKRFRVHTCINFGLIRERFRMEKCLYLFMEYFLHTSNIFAPGK